MKNRQGRFRILAIFLVFLILSGTGAAYYYFMFMNGKIPVTVPVLPGTGGLKDVFEEPAHDTVYLRNNDVLYGDILNEVIEVKTDYAKVPYQLDRISKLEIIREGDRKQDRLISLSGDHVTGLLALDQFRFKLRDGGEISIDKEKVKSIRMKKRVSREQGTVKKK